MLYLWFCSTALLFAPWSAKMDPPCCPLRALCGTATRCIFHTPMAGPQRIRYFTTTIRGRVSLFHHHCEEGTQDPAVWFELLAQFEDCVRLPNKFTPFELGILCDARDECQVKVRELTEAGNIWRCFTN